MAKFDCVPPTLGRYNIPRSILTATVDSLRITGQGRKEAVALWQGRVVSDRLAKVTKLIVPTQITGARHFNIPLDERLRIMDDLNRIGEFILIQLHTHPREAFHSQADDQYAVTKHLHALSIVIPHFGMHWTGRFSETSVNLNLGAGVWRELPPADVDRLLEIV